MKLADVRNQTQFIEFWQGKGLRCSENALVATVYPVHAKSPTGNWLSRHYMVRNKQGVITPGPLKPVYYGGKTIQTPQGKLGTDWNWNAHAHAPGEKRWKTETEALTEFYERTLGWAEKHDIPLHELFFANFGFMEQYGYRVNHPITNHQTHAHMSVNDTHFYRD